MNGPGFFHAVALDYDGTLVEAETPGEELLAAIEATRRAGRKAVLVTGRILSELRGVFPAVDTTFDLLVGENGAVISVGGRDRPVAPPVPVELDDQLRARNVEFQRGQALLACRGEDEQQVLTAVRELGLELQLTRNRGALMVLPAGVTKGTGLFEGLAFLGISHHNVVAVGDAENDHSLLDGAELGVAVANAVGSLKAHADLVLERPDGAGAAALLRGPVLAGQERVHSRRWQVDLGETPDGLRVTIPASQINLLITGPPRWGKSYLAGSIAEKLVGLRYSVLVLDPEGDHTALGHLRGVLVVGGRDRLPSPGELDRLIAHRFSSVVLDMSGLAPADRAVYMREIPRMIEAERAATGLPHWLILDEAQDALGRDSGPAAFPGPETTGFCLVTHLPGELCPDALRAVDALISLGGSADVERSAALISAAGGLPGVAARRLAGSAGAGLAVLADRAGHATVFRMAGRGTRHLRHWHKYSTGGLIWERRFHFRSDPDTLTGSTAANIEDLERELRGCPDSVVVHHCRHADLSRWVAEVLGDPVLAAAVAGIESDLNAGRVPVHQAREKLISAVEERYPG